MKKFNIYKNYPHMPTAEPMNEMSAIATQISSAIFNDSFCLAAEVGSNEDGFQVRQNKHLPIGSLELNPKTAKEWEAMVESSLCSMFNMDTPKGSMQMPSVDKLIERYKFTYAK